MDLRPTLGDEKTPRSRNHSLWNRCPFLCHPDRSEAERRDLRFYGPFVEMFFDGGVPRFRSSLLPPATTVVRTESHL